MSQRTKALDDISDYYDGLGIDSMTAKEYATRTDTPVRFQSVRRIFGSWKRMEIIMRDRRTRPETTTDSDAVEVARSAALAAEFEARQAASKMSDEVAAGEEAEKAPVKKPASSVTTK
jgi:hypothetical protein